MARAPLRYMRAPRQRCRVSSPPPTCTRSVGSATAVRGDRRPPSRPPRERSSSSGGCLRGSAGAQTSPRAAIRGVATGGGRSSRCPSRRRRRRRAQRYVGDGSGLHRCAGSARSERRDSHVSDDWLLMRLLLPARCRHGPRRSGRRARARVGCRPRRSANPGRGARCARLERDAARAQKNVGKNGGGWLRGERGRLLGHLARWAVVSTGRVPGFSVSGCRDGRRRPAQRRPNLRQLLH